MNKNQLWTIALLATSGLIPRCALAQITLDGTLGPPRNLIGPQYHVRQADGQTVGDNLFHSFGQFSVNQGEAVTFESTPSIRNILSRVTGSNSSYIDGLIATQSPNVNLFLLNPSGIVFGPNAAIDIGSATRGSFVATTVDALVWPNGEQFSATRLGRANRLLTISGDPGGFLALQRPAPIRSFGSTLSVYEGQSLILLGGNIRLNDSFLFVDLNEGGSIELGGVRGEGIVGLEVNNDLLSSNFPNDVARADVSLINSSIDATAENGGSIAINARNIEILEDSLVAAGIYETLGSTNSQAGDVTLNASGTITIGSSAIENGVYEDAIGSGGNIHIHTGSLFLANSSTLNADTLGQGNSGDIIINARDRVSFNYSDAYTDVDAQAVGQGGDIRIETGSLFLTNGSTLNADTSSQGNAGNIIINARDRASIRGTSEDGYYSGIFSEINSGAQGNGGRVEITTGLLFVADGAALEASLLGRGNASNIIINARDRVIFDGGGAYSEIEPGANGSSGDITIRTGSISFSNNSRLEATNQGQGNAGSIIINARETASFDSSFVLASVQANAIGDGGDIRIYTDSLRLTNGAYLASNTFGRGDAGTIIIDAHNTVSLDGFNSTNPSAAFSEVDGTGRGQGGDIRINTGSLFLSRGALLQASTFGRGDAGNIIINAHDRISFNQAYGVSSVQETGRGQGGDIRIHTTSFSMSNEAGLFSRSLGRGDAGEIEVSARQMTLDQSSVNATNISQNGGNIFLQNLDSLVLRQSSLISTEAGTSRQRSGGNGGNIRIDADFVVSGSSDNSDIVANAFDGRGGNIAITTQGIFGIEFRDEATPESDITASSTFGIDGEVEITRPDVDPSQGLVELPETVVDASTQIAQTCSAAGRTANSSEFIVTGRGGLPPSPADVRSSDAILTEWVTLNSDATQVAADLARPSPQTSIVEAQSWVQGINGEVTLIAAAPIATAQQGTIASCR